ncbi:MAG: hypothetical protein HC840_24920 [Leptolyngbyaceae cyanobacterium RM2_2_4]|nr:hypothetical protein [Leptolyngbyaceae cyanobacterium SM1_4_3]NJO52106.1 hypothetical protein [Leptolyngbyaceae cyanobacterium RM2_2_4]
MYGKQRLLGFQLTFPVSGRDCFCNTPGGFGQSAALELLAEQRPDNLAILLTNNLLGVLALTVLLRRYRKGRPSPSPPPLSPERLAPPLLTSNNGRNHSLLNALALTLNLQERV